MLIVIAGLAGGIFAYAKKKGYTYLEGAKEIARKAITVISAAIANAKSKGGTDKQTGAQGFQDVSSNGNTSGEKHFACPHCGQHFEFDPEIAGMEADCPTCGHSFIVPEINDNAQ